MKQHHKYFRNQRHKNKLEQKVLMTGWGYGRYYYFMTKEPDPASLREWPFTPDIKARGKDYYCYYCNRPTIPYTIRQGQRRRTFPKYYRNYCNRRLRKTFKDDIYDNCLYKKLTEYWWTID